MRTIISYFRARILEQRTWVGIGLAIAAASVLPHPWNIYSVIAGVIGSLVPDGTIKKD